MYKLNPFTGNLDEVGGSTGGSVGGQEPFIAVCETWAEVITANTAAGAAGGGTIIMREGTFTMTANITLSDNTRLIGSGWTATTVSLDSAYRILIGSSGEISQFKVTTTKVSDYAVYTGNFCKVNNIWFDISTSSRALQIQNGYVNVDSCWFGIATAADLVINTSQGYCSFTNNKLNGCGFSLSGNENVLTNNTWLASAPGYNIRVRGNENTISNNYFVGDGSSGCIYSDSNGQRTKIIGNVFDGSGTNIKFDDGTGDFSTILGNTLDGTLNIAGSGTDEVIVGANKIATFTDNGTGTIVLQTGIVYKTALVSLSAANIIAMGGTPVQLLATPGAGKVNVINQVLFDFTYNSTQFTGGDVVTIKNATGTSLLTGPAAALIQGTANFTRMYFGTTDADYVTNEALNITTAAGTNFATGNSTMKVRVTYQTITL